MDTYGKHAHVKVDVQRNELRDYKDRSNANGIDTVFQEELRQQPNAKPTDLVRNLILLSLELGLVFVESRGGRRMKDHLQTGDQDLQKNILFLLVQAVKLFQ